MSKENIFRKRNPFDNIKSSKAKNFIDSMEKEDLLKEDIMKLDGAKLTKVDRDIIDNIDFEDREFINREVKFNELLTDEKLQELSKSIGSIGLINPIYLIEKKKNQYKILSGFRRSTAIFYGYNNIEKYEVLGGNNLVIIPNSAPYELLDTISLHENTLREDLTTLELSLKIWKESKHRGKKVKEIATDYGISERSVARYLKVEKYPEELLNQMENISNIRKSDIIYDFLKINNFEDIEENIKMVIDLESSVIEKEIKNKKLPTGQDNVLVKKRKNKVIIEIFKQLEKDQIIEIENYIQKFIEK